MNNNYIDVLLINPGDRRQIYQNLGEDISAIEPPVWIAIQAAYLRNEGINVRILDSNALNISPEETAEMVRDLNPELTVVIVFGSQPSASTQNMTIAYKICASLNEKVKSKTALGGLHPTALPEQTINEGNVDFVIEGEGFLTVKNLVQALKSGKTDFNSIKGLWWKNDGIICHTERLPIVQNEKEMDSYYPVAAWDLLPMDKYRAHNWHCFKNMNKRSPYASVYTSFGCPYYCSFCCINSLFGKNLIRFRNPSLVLEEIDLLVNRYNIKNIKIADELFILNEDHYMKIINGLIDRKYDLNIWAYARLDTINISNLDKMKKAGINWLALGIEAANIKVLNNVHKGIKNVSPKDIINSVRDAGISVIGNYIFGLPEDTVETMKETLDLAIDLNCEFANFYCAMAYPGSRLYAEAKRECIELPPEWHGFSQHSFETLPLPTKYVTAEEVLEFRDNAHHKYYNNPEYLTMIENKFGKNVKENIIEINKIRLKRKILLSKGAEA